MTESVNRYVLGCPSIKQAAGHRQQINSSPKNPLFAGFTRPGPEIKTGPGEKIKRSKRNTLRIREGTVPAPAPLVTARLWFVIGFVKGDVR